MNLSLRHLLHKAAVSAKTLGAYGLQQYIIAFFQRPVFSEYTIVSRRIASARCLEIGGPSPIFERGGAFPVYGDAATIDGCNFSSTTMWQGSRSPGSTYAFDPHKPAGRYFVSEAGSLTDVPSGEYDCILSSHVIEHIANPLRALREWGRVITGDGILVLVVPHRDGTFDHRRPLTTIKHLIHDEESAVDESDETHVQEFLNLTDLKLTRYGKDRESFRKTTLDNLHVRGIHHHVFDAQLAIEMTEACGFSILAAQTMLPNNIIIVAQKERHRVSSYAKTHPELFHQSPFRTDRMKFK